MSKYNLKSNTKYRTVHFRNSVSIFRTNITEIHPSSCWVLCRVWNSQWHVYVSIFKIDIDIPKRWICHQDLPFWKKKKRKTFRTPPKSFLVQKNNSHKFWFISLHQSDDVNFLDHGGTFGWTGVKLVMNSSANFIVRVFRTS